MVASQRGSRKKDLVETRTTSDSPIGSRCELIKVGDGVAAEEVQSIREIVVNAAVSLIAVKSFAASGKVITGDRAACDVRHG